MKNRNSGFTLAEVLVSIVIGVISIAAAFASYNYFNKSYKSVSQKAAINSSAREALSIITKDLRNTGYMHVDFTKESHPEWYLIEFNQKELGNLDQLIVYQGTSPNSWIRTIYSPKTYDRCQFTVAWCSKYGNGMYLAKTLIENPTDPGSTRKVIYENIEFVPNIVDFQIVFKDREGKEVYPVCSSYCNRLSVSQGAETPSNNKPNKGTLNMPKVYTAEIYLTIQSAKEVFNSDQATRIINHENGTFGNTQNFDDKYYRETFFASVHTRNLAKHVAISEQTGTSIGESSTYNK